MLTAGATVAAGVALEVGFSISHQLPQKAGHIACDGVCGLCSVVRARGSDTCARWRSDAAAAHAARCPATVTGHIFPAHTRASPLAWCAFLVWRIQKKCSHEAALDDKNYTRIIFEALKKRPDKKRFEHER